MFARPSFRAAAPLRQSVRAYATAPESKGPGFGLFAVIGAAAAAGGLGYTYFQGNPAALDKLDGPPKKAFVGGEQGFLPLKLGKVEDLSHNTKRISFNLPESDQVSGLDVASAVLFKHQKEGEKATLRPYTPVSDVDEKGHIDFVIKKYPNGAMTEHIWEMKEGDAQDIKGPLPKYPITPNKHDHIAMICGGTGITPMYQVMRAILTNPEDQTKVSLVYGNVTEDDILLKKELNELENTYPRRFRAFYTLDKPPEGWSQGKGFITKDLLKQVLPEPKEDNIKIFVCGPPGMYKAISGAKVSPKDQGELEGSLKDLGYSKDQVFKF